MAFHRAIRSSALAASILALGCQSAETPNIRRGPHSSAVPNPHFSDASAENIAAVVEAVNFEEPVDDVTLGELLESPARALEGNAEAIATPRGERDTDDFAADARAEQNVVPEASRPPLAIRDLEDCLALATANHPSLVAADAAVAAARGQQQQAGLPFNPNLVYQSDEIGNDDSTGLHGIAISQRYVTADKLRLAAQVASRDVARAIARRRRNLLQVQTRVRTAYIVAGTAQQRLRLNRQILELAETAAESAANLFEAEEVSRIVVLQARVEVDRAAIRVEATDAERVAAEKVLAAAIGLPDLHFGELPLDLADDRWRRLDPVAWWESPELASQNELLRRAQWALRLACARVVPDVTGSVGVGVDTASDQTFATLGVSVQLPIRNRNQGNIAAARAEIHRSAAAIDEVALDLQRRMATLVGQFESSHRIATRLDRDVITAAEESYELSRQAFESGEIDYLQLLTAQRTLFDTRLRLLQSRSDAAIAVARIEGLLVEFDAPPSR